MNKNKEKLDSLTTFLNDHPELRFWQGLLAWAQEYYKNDKNAETFKWLMINANDTYYWE